MRVRILRLSASQRKEKGITPGSGTLEAVASRARPTSEAPALRLHAGTGSAPARLYLRVGNAEGKRNSISVLLDSPGPGELSVALLRPWLSIIEVWLSREFFCLYEEKSEGERTLTGCLTNYFQIGRFVSIPEGRVDFTEPHRNVMLENYKNLTTTEWEMQIKSNDLKIQQDTLWEKISNRVQMTRSRNGQELYDCERSKKDISDHFYLRTHRSTENGTNFYEDNQIIKLSSGLQIVSFSLSPHRAEGREKKQALS
ncbi:hypothetical protein R6Z07F_006553 [Ovis aries]